MKRKVNVLPAMICVLLLLLVAGGCQQANVEQAAAVDETEPKDNPATTEATKSEATSPEERDAETGNGGAVVKAGDVEVRTGKGGASVVVGAEGGKVKAGDAVAGGGEVAKERGSGDRPGRLKLKIRGKPGTEFSGTCAIGDEERDVSGRVPARFVYEPEGREVACEIQNGRPDAGPLKFSVTAEGSNRKQKVKVTGDTMSFSFSGSGISYSTSSASGSAVQKTKITSSSSNSSVSSSGSR